MNESGTPPRGAKTFVSYSSADRVQANALRKLFIGLGHEVFHDHVSIKPGERWRNALDVNIATAELCVVLWTANASKSKEVRKEYEYFHTHQAEEGGHLIPIFGDETPLDDILAKYQSPNPPGRAGVVSAVLETKRLMLKEGHSKDAIAERVETDLKEAGFDPEKAGMSDDPEEMRQLTVALLGFDWWGLLKRHAPTALSRLKDVLLYKAARNIGPIASAVGAAGVVTGIFLLAGRADDPPVGPIEMERDSVLLETALLGDSLALLAAKLDTALVMLDSIDARLGGTDGLRESPSTAGGGGDPSPDSLTPEDLRWIEMRLSQLVADVTSVQNDLTITKNTVDRIYLHISGLADPAITWPRPHNARLDQILFTVRRSEETLSRFYDRIGELGRHRIWLTDRERIRIDTVGLASLLSLRLEIAETRRVAKLIFSEIARVAGTPELKLEAIAGLLRTELAGPAGTLSRLNEQMAELLAGGGGGDGGLVDTAGGGSWRPLTNVEVRDVFRAELAVPRDTLNEVLRLLSPDPTRPPTARLVRSVKFFRVRGPYSEPPVPLDTASVLPADVEASAEGELAIVAAVGPDGRVRGGARATFFSPRAAPLVEWAKETVEGWRFEPAQGEGAAREFELYVAFFVTRPGGD